MRQQQRCVIYSRFSPRKNADTCESCETQIALCEEYAFKKGWEIVQTFSDKDVSGADELRPLLWQAVDSLRKGDVLLCWKRDRLARDLYLMCAIRRAVKKHGGIIHTVEQGEMGTEPEDVFRDQIIDAVAELERKLISARTRASMLQHQREGRRMSHDLPYGWKQDPADKKRMLMDDLQQKVISEIVAKRDAGESYRSIADALNRKGGTKVTPWTSTGVMRVYKREKM